MEKLILIVDDSSTVRHQLRTVLEDDGFRVIEADSGETGVKKAREHEADLFIIDVNMPGIDGLEMLSEIRALSQHARTPAFILTTESSATLIKRGKQIGATAWIVKPFKPEILLKGVRKVLEV
ncbi:MAG: response regulator [Proteobacteria bacterium]|nr:response regulator [Pseudomonadota bacterium]